MGVLIIALPRTGSTELGNRISNDVGLKYIFEPYNPLEPVKYQFNYEKVVVKTMIFHTPDFIKEEQRIDWLVDLSKNFDKVILLSRKDLTACAESWAFLTYKTKEGFKSAKPYIWEMTPNYNECIDFIKKCESELNFLSKSINIPITYYEDIYDINDINRLRKGNRNELNTSLL